jgi:hypothetical protein
MTLQDLKVIINDRAVYERLGKHEYFVTTKPDGTDAIIYTGSAADAIKHMPKKAQIEYAPKFKASRDAIIAEIKAEAAVELAAREEREKIKRERMERMVTFYTSGWESHKVTIDPAEDIGAQCDKIAAYYHNDCTPERVRGDYESAIKAAAEKRVARIAELEKIIADAEGQALPTEAEREKKRREYNRMMNEGGDGYNPWDYKLTVEGLENKKAQLAGMKNG